MKKIAALIAVLLLGASARAIELSLEENRGERGSVGYVDMQRLFADSPDAQRAKESFEDLVRQAEERVNLRKAELLKLRQELDSARTERDMLAQSMALAPAGRPPAPPRPVRRAGRSGRAPRSARSFRGPLDGRRRRAAPPPPNPRTLALPGMSTMSSAPTASSSTAVASSTQPAAIPVLLSSPRRRVRRLHGPAAPPPAAAPVVSSTAAAAAAACCSRRRRAGARRAPGSRGTDAGPASARVRRQDHRRPSRHRA